MIPRTSRLPVEQLLQLRRLSTPTVYNGWEQITRHDAALDGFNLEEAVDFGPQLGPMVGYAVTLLVDVSGKTPPGECGNDWAAVRRYVADQPGPKVLVLQDVDKPRCVGSVWGEVSGTIFRGLGCVGTITDGGLRDTAEMVSVGFKAIGRRLCVGHARPSLLAIGTEVEVFGRRVKPGQLIHADHHGFLAIPEEDEPRLLEAALFMDATEAGLIHAGRNLTGCDREASLKQIDAALDVFRGSVKGRFERKGEW